MGLISNSVCLYFREQNVTAKFEPQPQKEILVPLIRELLFEIYNDVNPLSTASSLFLDSRVMQEGSSEALCSLAHMLGLSHLTIQRVTDSSLEPPATVILPPPPPTSPQGYCLDLGHLHLSQMQLTPALFQVSLKRFLYKNHIRILGIELELACNGGSLGGISLKIFACEKITLHEPRLQASPNSIPIQIWYISVY